MTARLVHLQALRVSAKIDRFGLDPTLVYEIGEPDERGMVDVRRPGSSELLARAPAVAFDDVVQVRLEE